MVLKPETGLQGKFSMSYCMAVALVHGQPRVHHFTDQEVKNPQLRSLMERVTQEGTERPTKEVSRPSTVTINLTDGREVRHRIEHAKGHLANPLSEQELDAKFEHCSNYLLSSEQIRDAISQFRLLEEVPDVAPLAFLLGG